MALPYVFTNAGNPVIDATQFNANFNYALANSTAIAISGNVDMSGLGVFNVKNFGAVGDGSTDDHAAIQAAINAAQNAGGGVVYLPAATYRVASGINIGGSHITLQGAGQDATIIQAPNGATFDILTIAGSGATPGNISTYSSTCTVRDLTVSQALSGTVGASTANVGIRVQYIIFPKIIDVNVANCGTGLRFTGAVDLFACRVRQTSSYASVTNGYGFYIDGTYQNASCYLADCVSSFGSFTGGTSYAYYVNGAHLSDLYLLRCEGDTSSYGFYFNGGSASGSTDTQDVHIIQFVADECTIAGINIVNLPDNAGMVQIAGGYTSAGANNHVGVNVSSSSGVLIDGIESYSATATGTQGITLSSSKNCSIVRNVVKGNHAQGIYVTSSSDYTIGHNVLTATASTASSMAIGIAGTAPNGSMMGNVISAVSTFQWRYGIYVGSNSDSCAVVGNVFDTAGIFASSQIVFADATNNKWHIAQNPGYNPVGKLASQPAVPLSGNASTNGSGVDCTYCLATGAGVTVSAVAVGGQTTGLTMAASSSLPIRVPAGQTITLTYSGGTPTWVVFGD